MAIFDSLAGVLSGGALLPFKLAMGTGVSVFTGESPPGLATFADVGQLAGKMQTQVYPELLATVGPYLTPAQRYQLGQIMGSSAQVIQGLYGSEALGIEPIQLPASTAPAAAAAPSAGLASSTVWLALGALLCLALLLR